MNGLFLAGREMQTFLEGRRWPFCFIGGLAVLRWGELRMTQDLDLCLLCGFGKETNYIDTLLGFFKSRISAAAAFARQNRVLLLQTSHNIACDVMLSGLEFEQEMINRATPFSFAPDCALITCSAEDLVVLKAFAGREKDWSDVEGILLRQGSTLDSESILRALIPFDKAGSNAESTQKLERLMAKIL